MLLHAITLITNFCSIRTKKKYNNDEIRKFDDEFMEKLQTRDVWGVRKNLVSVTHRGSVSRICRPCGVSRIFFVTDGINLFNHSSFSLTCHCSKDTISMYLFPGSKLLWYQRFLLLFWLFWSLSLWPWSRRLSVLFVPQVLNRFNFSDQK